MKYVNWDGKNITKLLTGILGLIVTIVNIITNKSNGLIYKAEGLEAVISSIILIPLCIYLILSPKIDKSINDMSWREGILIVLYLPFSELLAHILVAFK